jgi:hypothetical protein
MKPTLLAQLAAGPVPQGPPAAPITAPDSGATLLLFVIALLALWCVVDANAWRRAKMIAGGLVMILAILAVKGILWVLP